MSNYNDWGVAFGTIGWFERALRNHAKVSSFDRIEDILFLIKRTDGLSDVNVLLVNEYTLGLASVFRAKDEFPTLNCIVTGANWNAYTPEAKRYGVENGIGIFVFEEFMGALWKDEPSTYVKKDEEGKPIYHYRAA